MRRFLVSAILDVEAAKIDSLGSGIESGSWFLCRPMAPGRAKCLQARAPGLEEVEMLPNLNYMPVEELVWMKRGELMHEFEQIRLQQVARISNPGLMERALLSVARILIDAGQGLREQYTIPRQAHVDAAARYAA